MPQSPEPGRTAALSDLSPIRHGHLPANIILLDRRCVDKSFGWRQATGKVQLKCRREIVTLRTRGYFRPPGGRRDGLVAGRRPFLFLQSDRAMAKAPKIFQPVIATGNNLRTGDVVFRTGAGLWSHNVTKAQVAETPEAAAPTSTRVPSLGDEGGVTTFRVETDACTSASRTASASLCVTCFRACAASSSGRPSLFEADIQTSDLEGIVSRRGASRRAGSPRPQSR